MLDGRDEGICGPYALLAARLPAKLRPGMSANMTASSVRRDDRKGSDMGYSLGTNHAVGADVRRYPTSALRRSFARAFKR